MADRESFSFRCLEWWHSNSVHAAMNFDVDIVRRCYTATCLAIMFWRKLHEKLRPVSIVCTHQVSRHFRCSKRCTKFNHGLVIATISAMLQRFFTSSHGVTPVVQLGLPDKQEGNSLSQERRCRAWNASTQSPHVFVCKITTAGGVDGPWAGHIGTE